MTIPFEKFWARLFSYPTNRAETNASISESAIGARLMKIGSRYAALPDTGRTQDEILGYDDDGLPT